MSDNDPLTRLERGIDAMDSRRRWETDNRLALLWGHSVIGLVSGILMMLFSTAQAWERIFGQWFDDPGTIAQVCVGMPAIVGGVVLGFGLSSTPRNMKAELVGLGFLLLWELMMTGAMIWGALHPPPGADPVPYPIAVYSGLAYFMCVHIRSIYKWSLQRYVQRWRQELFRRKEWTRKQK